MAITVLQQPSANDYQAAGNPIELLVSSSNTGATNFKLDVKLYYDPTGVNTLIAGLKFDPLPGTSNILIDIAPLLRSKLTDEITNLRTSATGVKNETTQLQYCNLKIQEYYGTIPALSGSVTTSNTILFQNAFLKYRGWERGDYDLYKINSASGANTLTQKLCTAFDNFRAVTNAAVLASPSQYFTQVKKITSDQLCQIFWLWTGSSGTNKKVVINTFDSSFASVISANKSLASAQSPSSLNIGTASLIAGGGALSALDSTSKYMSLSVESNSFQLTGTYFYEIDWSPCSRFDSYEIHWKNRYGGWDSWVFDKKSKHNTEIQRQTFNPASLPVSGSTIVHNSYDITNVNSSVSTKESYEIKSKYLKAWELEGLEDLITSTKVYWNSPDGFINVMINSPEVHEHKTNTIDKLFNLSFNFTIDNQDVRQ